MMIMNMNDVGSMFPGYNPIENSNLESGEAFIIIIITIYFFPVEQTIDIDQVKVETKNVSCFFDYCEFEPPVAQICIALMNDGNSTCKRRMLSGSKSRRARGCCWCTTKIPQ